jgi:hypothetical protein
MCFLDRGDQGWGRLSPTRREPIPRFRPLRSKNSAPLNQAQKKGPVI